MLRCSAFVVHQVEKEVRLTGIQTRGCRDFDLTSAKDCEQLAIESYMLMKEHNLDYLPACRSVVIDSGTKQHIHREWTGDQIRWGIDNAKLCAKIYWNKRMNPKVK